MKRYVIINASPLAESRSAAITKRLADQLIRQKDVAIEVLEVGKQPVSPCIACDGCKQTHECIIDDAMQDYYKVLDAAEALIIVTPVYFAGPPAQLKAFFDRLQPYYYGRKRPSNKRDAYLFIVREGGDPHGFDPLVTITRSALAVAEFKIVREVDYLGVYDDDLVRLTDDALTQAGLV